MDIIQATREAIVASLDNRAEITAITGRTPSAGDAPNILPWRDDTGNLLPALAYLVVVGRELGAPGDTREIDVQISAFATDESVVNALLEVCENVLIAPTFSALPTPLDAYSYNRVRQAVPFDEGSDTFRGDLTLTLVVTKH